MVFRPLLYLFIFIGLQGCSAGWLPNFPLFNKSQSSAGPKPIFEPQEFEKLDLAKILGQDALPNSAQTYKGTGERREFPVPFWVMNNREVEVSLNGVRKEIGKDYDLQGVGSKKSALIVFTAPPPKDAAITVFFAGSSAVDTEIELTRLYSQFEDRFPNDGGKLKRARNQIQERIIAASNSRCSEYKRFLMQFESEGNFFWGAASIITGGLGAIFVPAATARALAGAAGISGGMHAEWQQDYFHKLTTQVIMSGIESKRQGIYRKILENQAKDYNDFTVMAAINQAVQYHGACSLVDGLQEASDAVRQAQDIGFLKLQEHLKAAGMKAAPITLAILPSPTASLSVDASPLQFTATGGMGKVTFSVEGDTSGGAAIDPLLGLLKPGTKAGVLLTVFATDQQGFKVGVPVSINLKFEFDPTITETQKNTTSKIVVKGGTPPYFFKLKQSDSGTSALSQVLKPAPSNELVYKSGATAAEDIIEATDSSTVPQTISLKIKVKD